MLSPFDICPGCCRDYIGNPLKPGEVCLCGTKAPLNVRPHMAQHVLTDDDTGERLATIIPVRNSSQLGSIINTPIINDGDGRSQWCWCRFANGDLMLGFFPQGEVYELASAMEQEDRV